MPSTVQRFVRIGIVLIALLPVLVCAEENQETVVSTEVPQSVAEELTLTSSQSSLPLSSDNSSRQVLLVPEAPVQGSRRGFSVGYLYGRHLYEEPGHMKQTGNLHGIGVGFESRSVDASLMFRLSAEAQFGGVSYEGSLYNRKTKTSRPWTTTGNDSVYSAKALVGVPFLRWASGDSGPFVGLGARYLNDQLEGRGAYEREVRYLFLPVGLETRFILGEDHLLTLTAEIDVFLGGTVKSHLSEAGRTHDPTNTQKKGQGTRIAADWMIRMSEHTDMHIIPYWQRWQVEDSEPQLVDGEWMLEPRNKTDQVGVSLAIGI